MYRQIFSFSLLILVFVLFSCQSKGLCASSGSNDCEMGFLSSKANYDESSFNWLALTKKGNIYTSVDGIAWDDKGTMKDDSGNIINNDFAGVAYGLTSNGYRWVVVTNESSFFSSLNGKSWTYIRKLTGKGVRDIAYGNNRWAIAGDDVTIRVSSYIKGSWRTIHKRLFDKRIFTGLTYSSSKLVAVGDGIIYETGKVGVRNNNFLKDVKSIASGNNLWIASGSKGFIYKLDKPSSTTRVAYKTISNNDLNDIAYGNGKWVAVGNSGAIVSFTFKGSVIDSKIINTSTADNFTTVAFKP